ncbi:unnamed protein product [Ectocarpus sp. 6 AP-2014]
MNLYPHPTCTYPTRREAVWLLPHALDSKSRVPRKKSEINRDSAPKHALRRRSRLVQDSAVPRHITNERRYAWARTHSPLLKERSTTSCSEQNSQDIKHTSYKGRR